MLRKHINDDSIYPVNVVSSDSIIGPCTCPQPGCQQGNVMYQEYGGSSGDYMTSQICKCCDGRGYLLDGHRPYSAYCGSNGARDISTGYPSPIPMSRQVYDSIQSKQYSSNQSKKPSSKSSKLGFWGWLVIIVIVFYILSRK